MSGCARDFHLNLVELTLIARGNELYIAAEFTSFPVAASNIDSFSARSTLVGGGTR